MSYESSREFVRARLQADLEQVLAWLTGKPVDLLAYDEVRRQLRVEGSERRVLKDIPLDAIVGSVGRYADFTRRFMPLHDSDRYRWIRVRQQAERAEGLPPIEVYQIRDVYFVRDGNHRVAVARHMGLTHIEAYVVELHTRVPLTPGVDAHDLLVKARYVEFLQHTRLDVLRPAADLTVTSADVYDALEQHIALHQYVLSVEQARDVPFEAAVTDWYDAVYMLIVQVIREMNALADFPGCTETDVYAWVSGYRTLLEEALDWEFETDSVAPQPADVPSFVGRVVGRVRSLVAGDASSADVLPGEWRRRKVLAGLTPQRGQSFALFATLLVPLSGDEAGWSALEQAFVIARHEHSRVLGLHVVEAAAQRDTVVVEALRDEFRRRCAAAGVVGALAVDVGPVASTICGRSGWVDLTVARLSYPPPSQLLPGLASGMRTLLRQCASPLLMLPNAPLSTLERVLVAYNASHRSDEALSIAAYLALHWNVELIIATAVEPDHDDQRILNAARQALEPHSIQATFVAAEGFAAEAILSAARTYDTQVVVMGGYGHHPLVEAVGGSVVDAALRQTDRPVLVC
ncbi:MAG: universal stress protein [Anaerolineae bacterium]